MASAPSEDRVQPPRMTRRPSALSRPPGGRCLEFHTIPPAASPGEETKAGPGPGVGGRAWGRPGAALPGFALREKGRPIQHPQAPPGAPTRGPAHTHARPPASLTTRRGVQTPRPPCVHLAGVEHRGTHPQRGACPCGPGQPGRVSRAEPGFRSHPRDHGRVARPLCAFVVSSELRDDSTDLKALLRGLREFVPGSSRKPGTREVPCKRPSSARTTVVCVSTQRRAQGAHATAD